MTSKQTTSQSALKVTSFFVRVLLNIVFYMVVIFIIVEASQSAYHFAYSVFGQTTMEAEPGRDIEIQIKSGESTMNVASKLELNRIIENKYSFYVKAKLKKHVIMPGTYTINTSMTYDQIFSIITVPTAGETDQTEE
ncbi:MAG: hypothetical protein K0R92_836 [Lachnospiraceae bacterium]|jgi:UPF0755 protein|nr:hypothetical protein [Anaerocolumna sp.]MDF2609362.1 hypothetical protein [Lachnospiraceae bacterium]